jgi:prepilin peptidase CpaA
VLNQLTPGGIFFGALILLGVLAMAALSDIRERRIPNSLVLAGLSSLCVLATFSGTKGFLWSFAGLTAALAIFFPIYAAGWLGAGDVKLIGLVGGFFGLQQLLPLILFITLAGGLVSATYFLLAQYGLVDRRVPYALAILVGVLAHLGFYQS